MTKPTEIEIEKVIDQCFEVECSGESMYPGMTYEQGVKNGIDWVNGDLDDSPLE
jgi:hypothetical protein